MRTPVLLTALALAAAGCAGESGLEIELRSFGVESGLTIDRLFVELVASQDVPVVVPETGQVYAYTCRPVSWGIAGDALRFPLTITVRPGDIDWACVGIRASGFRNDELAIRAEDLFCEDLAEGVHRVQLELTSGCLVTPEAADCDADSVCRCDVGAVCTENEQRCRTTSPVAALFDAAPAVSGFCDVAAGGQGEGAP